MTIASEAAIKETQPQLYPFEYTTPENRKVAMQGVDFSQTDPVMDFLLGAAEIVYQSKRVLTANDWLQRQKENG